MMGQSLYGTTVPRNTFKTFLIMWGLIFFIAILAVILFSTRQAHAEFLLPVHKMEKVTHPATITSFTEYASPATVEQQCQFLLSPTTRIDSVAMTKNVIHPAVDNRNRRNADMTGVATAIKAVKAYRQCMRKMTLQELAKR